jgi:hypothetical protein
VCGEAVCDEDIACARCDTPYHADCFRYVGRCSMFGCPGVSAVPYRHVRQHLLPALLEPSAASDALLDLRRLSQSLVRRAWLAAGDLRRTVPAGLAGGLAGFAIYALVFWSRRAFWRHAVAIGGALVACGVLFGMLSPLFAPAIHRRPWVTAATALAAFAALFVFGDFRTGWIHAVPVAVLTATAATLFATTVAELAFGRFTGAGRALGRAAAGARMLVTSLSFFTVCGVAATALGLLRIRGVWLEIAAWSVMAGIAGSAAFDAGKEEHRKRLLAEEDARRALAPPG